MRTTIFFDIGHTIATGSEMSPRRLINYRLNLGEEKSKQIGEIIMTTFSNTPEELFKAVYPILSYLDGSLVMNVLREVWEEQRHCVELLPEVPDVLCELKRRGFELGIISNIWHPFYEGLSIKYGEVMALFSHRILSYVEGVKKPSREIYRRASFKAGERLLWMIGDSYEMDILPAHLSGFKTVWFIHRPEREKKMVAKVIRKEMVAPDFAICDLRELLEFFKEG